MKSYFLLYLSVLLFACGRQVDTPEVLVIYPTSDVLPENLLRMYIQFSQPMKTIGNIEKIKLTDEFGEEVENVFFNNVHELWNKEQTQLTLILDPARVKTGLKAKEALGRAIRRGENYTLTIAGLEDVYHQKMGTVFKKKIKVDNADFTIPEIQNWEYRIPELNTKNSFEVSFHQMLDYNSLRSRLIITDSNNNPLEGTISIKEEETQWSFLPKNLWKPGEYVLHVNTRLEDPSGNNLNGLFDHKTGSLKYRKEGVVERIPFSIK